MWTLYIGISLLIFNVIRGTTASPVSQGKTIDTNCSASFECLGKLLCYQGTCQCVLQHYWNGSDCVMKTEWNSQCQTNAMCQQGLVCNGTCKCPANEFRSENRCLKKRSARESCASTEECQWPLHCARDICQCYSTDYWDGNKCTLRKDIDSNCSSSLECKETLDCFNSKCKCSSTEFWNGTYCAQKKPANSICTQNIECSDAFQCRSNICQCSITKFVDGENCSAKKKNAESCNADSECMGPLHCRYNECMCDETEYWSGFGCYPRRGVDGTCYSELECKEGLECSSSNKCTCEASYYWDGMKCQTRGPSECSDIASSEDGIYEIYPGNSGRKRSVYCLMRGNEKWTVFQRRYDGSVDFKRSWKQYKNGFGYANEEYWLGNDNLHLISKNEPHELSVYLEDWHNRFVYANYSKFSIGNEDTRYQISYSGYIGDAGNSLQYSYRFGTYDNDYQSCSEIYDDSGWWYSNSGCSYYYAAVNGKYNGTNKGFKWYHWTYSWNRPLKKSILMIRKSNLPLRLFP